MTAKGGISGTVTDPIIDGDGGNSMNATAELLIPGVVEEFAQTNAGIEYLGGVAPPRLNSTTSNVTVNFGPTSSYSGGFSLNDQQFQIDTNTQYVVELYAELGGGPTLSDAKSFVDPMFTTPNGYQLFLSPGILNGTPGGVPEPSTWAMLLIGFAGLGFAGLRASRKAAAVSA